MNAIFKVHRYAPDDPNLVGNDLTPGPPLVTGAQQPVEVDAGLDGDGSVDFADFLQLSRQIGKIQGDPAFDSKCDLNGDGKVDFSDFLRFTQAYGKPASTRPAEATKPAVR